MGLGKQEAVSELPAGPTAMTSLLAKNQDSLRTESEKVVRLNDYRQEKGLPLPDLLWTSSWKKSK
jgi:hypothetical protein